MRDAYENEGGECLYIGCLLCLRRRKSLTAPHISTAHLSTRKEESVGFFKSIAVGVCVAILAGLLFPSWSAAWWTALIVGNILAHVVMS